VCHGLDTISTILLNGKFIGKSDNQFRRFLFEIPIDVLKESENMLCITFEPAAKYAADKALEYPYEG